MAQKVFVVGAGALGCEFLKNFALMGVGCGAEGRVTVTDMDRIEVSNLNRQFLFRAHHVGSQKSVTAAAAAVGMNEEMKVEALEVPVGRNTENVFNDPFWSGLDIVTNALDNVEARKYVDNQCIWYGKPLLESGTLGTMANVQVVAPFLTEGYGDSSDPPEDSIPMCTLKNFPHLIEHCIEWARDFFQGTFCNAVSDAAAFARNPTAWLALNAEERNVASRKNAMINVLECLNIASGASFQSCVRFAALLFHNKFFTDINQLLHNFPKDYADPSTGVKFWQGVKRAPNPADLDPTNNQYHYLFLVHATALAAFSYGVALPVGWDSAESLSGALAGFTLPPFLPKKVHIKVVESKETEPAETQGGEDDEEALRRLREELMQKGECYLF